MTYLRKIPGFRSHTGWKMGVGAAAYLFILLIILAVLVPANPLEARLAEARTAAELGEYALAVERYDELLAQWDDQRLETPREAVEAEREEAGQQWAVSLTVAAAAALESGQLEQAQARLIQAQSLWPEVPGLDDLFTTLDVAAGHGGASLTVHFIDVGQGDATLLAGPDFTMLIDAGRHDRHDVVPYLQLAGVEDLDLVVGTHPHADHIGQLDQVLATYPVHEVWMSGDAHTTRTFERVVDAILASDAGYHEPRAGEIFTFGSAIIEVLNPVELSGDLHEGSLSFRVRYGDISFLFSGDAEAPTEQAMVQRGHGLQANVLQLGHHGSRTSSSRSFLQAVQPEVAIYSAAQGNPYGHPHGEALERLAAVGIPVYGTDVNGTILITTDGRSYQVEVSREGDPRAPPTESSPAEGDDAVSYEGCELGQIDINTASVDALQEIVHIGEVRAEDLAALRPFASVDDMTRIEGIGPSRLADIKAQNVACVP